MEEALNLSSDRLLGDDDDDGIHKDIVGGVIGKVVDSLYQRTLYLNMLWLLRYMGHAVAHFGLGTVLQD